MIFKHYLLRNMKHPLNIGAFIFLPLIISVINIMIIADIPDDALIGGVNIVSTQILFMVIIMFQLFAPSLVYDMFWIDFRSDLRWRLLGTPVSINKFLFSLGASSIVVALLASTILIVFGVIVFDMYLFNIGVTIAVMFILAVFSTFLGMLIAIFSKSKGAAEGICHIFVWPQVAPVMMLGISHPIVTRFTPYALAINAIQYSSETFADGMQDINMAFDAGYDMNTVFINIGVLAALTVVTGIVVVVMGKRRAF